MQYFAIACDYDGTLAFDGRVDDETVDALKRIRESGRQLILATGRVLDELQQLLPNLDLFDSVVAENGALLYHPATQQEKALAERPSEEFINALSKQHVEPLSVGRVIVATWQPHEAAALKVIRDLGLELQVIFNKGAVMVLPSGINKATGLKVALSELGLSAHNTVGIGDAENDHAFLSLCQCAVAVANALPTVKERADLVTDGDHGRGVTELIDRLLENDLEELQPHLKRHEIALGLDENDREVGIRPYGENILISGTSQGGKTTLTTGIIERLIEKNYQVCVIDPEGDYEAVANAVVVRIDQKAPALDEVIQLLAKPDENVITNLLGIELEERPRFFSGLFPQLQELRARTGRPHWIVIDETHHFLPSSYDPAQLTLPQEPYGLVLITTQPQNLAANVLSTIDTVIAIGDSPEQVIRSFCEVIDISPPPLAPTKLGLGEVLLWSRERDKSPLRVRTIPPQAEARRHRRKYAEGELPPERSFYFRGPEGKLNLRAQNLQMFLQLAEGVDDETWLYHLRNGDYSGWFRHEINDDELAEAAAAIEHKAVSAVESRRALKAAVDERYTAQG